MLFRRLPISRSRQIIASCIDYNSFATAASSGLKTVRPSTTESERRRLTPQNIQLALEAIHEDGMVMIEGAILNIDQINRLNRVMVKDAIYLQNTPHVPYNYNKGNIQQDPPVSKELFFPDIFLNPLAIQIGNAFLGPRPKMTFNSANTAFRATEAQPVHTDADFDHPKIPFALVVNIGLVDMTPINGSTEVWLGTQLMAGVEAQTKLHGDRNSGQVRPELLEARRQIRPPIQPYVPKGAILLRDLRLWHCGRPNQTDEIRVMLAQIYFAPWYRNPMRLEFPNELRPLLESTKDIEISADFVDGEIDHLGKVKFGNFYDFGQRD